MVSSECELHWQSVQTIPAGIGKEGLGRMDVGWVSGHASYLQCLSVYSYSAHVYRTL
jgi:hypothetical protein